MFLLLVSLFLFASFFELHALFTIKIITPCASGFFIDFRSSTSLYYLIYTLRLAIVCNNPCLFKDITVLSLLTHLFPHHTLDTDGRKEVKKGICSENMP